MAPQVRDGELHRDPGRLDPTGEEPSLTGPRPPVQRDVGLMDDARSADAPSSPRAAPAPGFCRSERVHSPLRGGENGRDGVAGELSLSRRADLRAPRAANREVVSINAETRTCLAIRHVAFEDLGLLAPLLDERGLQVRYLEAGVDDLAAVDPLRPDLLVILGGPIGADDETGYPFLADEVALLRRRLAADRPTLGLCLGAQLMARALGARVRPAAQKEIGWAPVRLTAAGRESCLRHLDGALTPVLHWHGDTFELPAGVEHLAATDICEHQAFRYAEHALALQFHAEAEGRALERWFIGHTVEIGATPGISVRQLRADTARHSATLREQGRRCFSEWLEAVGL